MNFVSFFSVIVEKRIASVHLVKLSTATMANLSPPGAFARGPIMYIPHFAKDHG